MAKVRKGRKPCAHDIEFVYDRTKQYALDDFQNLSIDKLQSIATSIQVHNVKRYKKEELVPIVLKKHQELLNREQEKLNLYLIQSYHVVVPFYLLKKRLTVFLFQQLPMKDLNSLMK